MAALTRSGSSSVDAHRIVAVDACEVLDSRGRPTVWCEVTLESGSRAGVAVPSGASTGRYERHELRDGGIRYEGRGVRLAVRNVLEVLGPAVRGLDARDQQRVDAALCAADGSASLERLGANAVLAISIATAVASAQESDAPVFATLAQRSGRAPLIPMPMVNVLSGGAHAANALDLQDVLVIPVAARSFAEAMQWAAAVRNSAVVIAEQRGLQARLAADEGGLGLQLQRNEDALELVVAAIEHSGRRPGEDVSLALDVAANQFQVADHYELRLDGHRLSAGELVDQLAQWCRSYPVVSVEDPLGDDDWAGWRVATERLDGVQLIGDDLFATDVERLRAGIAQGIANGVLVKPNQVGTVSGALAVMEAARSNGYATILSARSGDTEDTWLADFSVGWATGQIKVGSTTRAERTAKWNRLLVIEHQLGDTATLARFPRSGS